MTKLSKLVRERINSSPVMTGVDVDWLRFNAYMFGRDYWSYDKDPILLHFRAVVKDYYHEAQNARCCYCSVEIDENKRLFDLEHIVDKKNRGDLMFEIQNVASSCVQCNLAKKTANVLIQPGAEGDPLATTSAEYLIVHPHHDEWSEHFKLDKYNRIIVKGKSKKGMFTFQLCGMIKRNVVRLADYFRFPHKKVAESILLELYSPSNPKRIEQFRSLVKLADSLNNPDASAVIKIVSNDLGFPLNP